ncbi:hypothetical protein EVAR_40952_1 [Eumeta japonica]|uniref:Uncharacterized protein n=1 Tax=Eumeta variegata TaxID=151549 RepID=A0A4C1X667_EUMVA|nr:hypothetical protein EVAR_40952_1 [Eumeta japonica]
MVFVNALAGLPKPKFIMSDVDFNAEHNPDLNFNLHPGQEPDCVPGADAQERARARGDGRDGAAASEGSVRRSTPVNHKRLETKKQIPRQSKQELRRAPGGGRRLMRARGRSALPSRVLGNNYSF